MDQPQPSNCGAVCRRKLPLIRGCSCGAPGWRRGHQSMNAPRCWQTLKQRQRPCRRRMRRACWRQSPPLGSPAGTSPEPNTRWNCCWQPSRMIFRPARSSSNWPATSAICRRPPARRTRSPASADPRAHRPAQPKQPSCCWRSTSTERHPPPRLPHHRLERRKQRLALRMILPNSPQQRVCWPGRRRRGPTGRWFSGYGPIWSCCVATVPLPFKDCKRAWS